MQKNVSGTGPFVVTTYRNPLGTTETNKAVYDPLGNYIPFQAWHDPRPPTGSYNSGSMGQLSSSQANPESLAVGCLIDGLPANCNKVANAVNKGVTKSLGIVGNLVAAFNAGFIPQYHTEVVQMKPKPGNWEGRAVVDVLDWVAVPGGQPSSEPNPQNPQRLTPEQHQTLRQDFEGLLTLPRPKGSLVTESWHGLAMKYYSAWVTLYLRPHLLLMLSKIVSILNLS